MKKIVILVLLSLFSIASKAYIVTQAGDGYNGQYSTTEAVSMPSGRIIAVLNDFNNGKYVVGTYDSRLTATERQDISDGVAWLQANNVPYSWSAYYLAPNPAILCFNVVYGKAKSPYCWGWI